jgi:hypothetical protein
MAYFANGTDGMVFDNQCEQCRYGSKPCPINLVQTMYNYEAVNNEVSTNILDALVNNSGECAMYKMVKKEFEDPVKKHQGIVKSLELRIQNLKDGQKELFNLEFWHDINEAPAEDGCIIVKFECRVCVVDFVTGLHWDRVVNTCEKSNHDTATAWAYVTDLPKDIERKAK